jgi:hypothetical protein
MVSSLEVFVSVPKGLSFDICCVTLFDWLGFTLFCYNIRLGGFIAVGTLLGFSKARLALSVAFR